MLAELLLGHLLVRIFVHIENIVVVLLPDLQQGKRAAQQGPSPFITRAKKLLGLSSALQSPLCS